MYEIESKTYPCCQGHQNFENESHDHQVASSRIKFSRSCKKSIKMLNFLTDLQQRSSVLQRDLQKFLGSQCRQTPPHQCYHYHSDTWSAFTIFALTGFCGAQPLPSTYSALLSKQILTFHP